MLYYERKFRKIGYTKIIGVDEVGRGCLAGPVVAGAVLLKSTSFAQRIDDSKKLTPLQRERAFFEIIEKSFFGIGIINEQIIDRVNILQATCLAMEQAVYLLLRKLKSADATNTCLLVDGNVRFRSQLPVINIIAGDSKSKSIACASILAKVIRDRIMRIYDRVFPEYGFLEHKGYGTVKHRRALKKFGPSLIHRSSFCGVTG
ncbi:MAG TPA: ribonuclease HII [Patescibacteria group bacterium]|nr:ribonuclease HII [Patescibacteria group bacterium]